MSSEEEKNQNQDKEPEINKESKLSSDSMNKRMEEIYDHHKKEEKTNQRPQSKYQRDQKQNENKEKEVGEYEVDEKELINKINEHFNNRQITKKIFLKIKMCFFLWMNFMNYSKRSTWIY